LAEELDLGLDDIFGPGEGGVGKSGDVGAARTHVDELAVTGADHAAAGDADHTNIQRTDIGLVAADARIFDGRPAVSDHPDIGAGAPTSK